MTPVRYHFLGEICGVGTEAGDRFVIGNWRTSPLGTFADVMHEAPDGVRTLFAPSDDVAEFVMATYTFDHVRLAPVRVERRPAELRIETQDLVIGVAIGRRTALGTALQLVPRRLAVSPAWCSAIDPVARRVVRGVRTRGSAGNDRREWYGATDQRVVDAVSVDLDGRTLGGLRDVWPPVHFGFSSTPRRPTIVTVTTTIEMGPIATVVDSSAPRFSSRGRRRDRVGRRPSP